MGILRQSHVVYDIRHLSCQSPPYFGKVEPRHSSQWRKCIDQKVCVGKMQVDIWTKCLHQSCGVARQNSLPTKMDGKMENITSDKYRYYYIVWLRCWGNHTNFPDNNFVHNPAAPYCSCCQSVSFLYPHRTWRDPGSSHRGRHHVLCVCELDGAAGQRVQIHSEVEQCRRSGLYLHH